MVGGAHSAGIAQGVIVNDDNEDSHELNMDEVQEVLNWALSACAMITLMHASPEHKNPFEAIERLDGFLEAVEIMYHNIPDCMEEPAFKIAEDCIADADAADNAVAELRDLLNDESFVEKLKGNEQDGHS